MTEPSRIPPPIQYPAMPRWCSRCEEFASTTHQPLCPIRVGQAMRIPVAELERFKRDAEMAAHESVWGES